MKITFFLSLVLMLTIGVALNGCTQGQPAETKLKQLQNVKPAIKKTHINDTLNFKDPALSALVQKTEKLFSVFDSISPFREYDTDQLNLDKSVLNDIRSSSDDSLSNTINGTSITGVLSGVIANNLLEILNWKNIDNYDLSLLLKNHLSVAKSPDGRLYSFSFDEQTGGTYHSQVSIIHYNPGNRSGPKTFMTDDDGGYVFDTDGYSEIDTINTKQGIKYLLIGDVRGCSTCHSYYVDLVHYNKNRFIKDFNYGVQTREHFSEAGDEETSIEYDGKTRHININYTTDDLTPTCNCGVLNDIKVGNGDFDEDSKESVDCIYAFNGRSFVLKRKKVKAVE